MLEPSEKPTTLELAELTLRLLRDGVDWAVRRKESVKVLDDRTLRRQESVDVELPALGTPPGRTEDGVPVYYAPLFFLRKMPHQPSRAENAHVSSELLTLASREALIAAGSLELTDSPSGLDSACDDLLRRLASDPQQADREDLVEACFKDIEAAHGPAHVEALKRDSAFPWLLSLLAKSSVVVIRLTGAEPRRRIVKLGYDESLVDVADDPRERLANRLGWDGYPLVIELPFIGAQNFHFQAEAPPGMQFVAAGLQDQDLDPNGEIWDDADFARKIHLYMPGTEHQHGALAWLLFRLRGEGFVGGALLAALLVALVLTLFAATANLIARNSSSAPSLLLALAGILASYVGRPGGHALTTRLLSSVRSLILSSAGLAFGAAAAIAVDPGKVSPWVLRPIWTVEALVAWAIVAILWLSARLPRRMNAQPSSAERLIRRLLGTPP